MSSSPLSVAETETAANKRRSGRVTRKPELFTEDFGGAKRKRAGGDDEVEDEDDDGEDEDAGESSSDQDAEDEPDEEELREKRSRKTKSAPKKPAAKRPRPNGQAVNLPIRSTNTKPRRPKRKGKAVDIADAGEVGGLYAEVFARGHTLDGAVAEWIKRFNEHESRAVADLVNFVLRCAGCESEVNEHDIEDVDGSTNKLGDLQDEFQAQNAEQNNTDYPIISKHKGTAAFKASVTGFFYTLVKAIDAAGILFVNVELIENIHVWLGAMSGAQSRPFRHTATVISLAITTALCEIGSELQEAASKALRHSESERKKPRANKGRVSALQEDAKQAQEKQAIVDTLVKDWFESVYIHRYRDVNDRIRVDCVQALGDWIIAYPDVFFDAAHLRYLGWVLSDSYAPARLEVIKQLDRLYQDKDHLAGLKTFTDRFRVRMVEMAALDSEANVRAAAVELLDSLREAGFLEPDDIDAIGKLIFDAEPRVRKAVVGFFAESVNDTYASKLEDLGGEEAVEEDLPEASASSERPNLQWLRLKCLAELLESYDESDSDLPLNVGHGPGKDNYHLHAEILESRFIVAADSLYSQIPAIQDWQMLAGLLLFDTSDEGQNGAAHGVEAQLKEMIHLSEKEDIILLDVLSASVKGEILRLGEAGAEKKGKKNKRQRGDAAEAQEEAVRHLAGLVPRLLKRFGDAPQTAAAVLRLERIVNLESFEDFHQDASAYTSLLGDINRQFLTHGDEEVLTEASRALLRAKDYREVGEEAGEKIEELWEETISTFTSLVGQHELAVRGGLPLNVLDALSKTVARIERLATISRPIEHLETVAAQPKSKRKSQASKTTAPLEALLALIRHGVPNEDTQEDPDDAAKEDGLALHAARAVSFYFLWAASEMKSNLESSVGLSDETLDSLASNRDTYVAALIAVLEARSTHDDLSVTVAEMLLDAHTLIATLRQIKPRDAERDDYLAIVLEMDAPVQKWILAVFGAVEQAYAKKTGRRLAAAPAAATATAATQQDAIDADPMDDDPLSEPEDEDEGPDDDAEDALDTQASQTRRAEKLQGQLVAEQRLCELTGRIVLAVLAGMMDAAATRARLERNKGRLGANFKELLRHLDAGGAGKGKGKKAVAAGTRAAGKAAAAAAAAAAAGAGAQKKSAEVVVESDEEDADDDANDEDEDEEGEEGLRRRELVEEPEESEHGNEDEEREPDVESVLGD